MKNLLQKELRLALHPTNIIFLSLSAMLLIPNYPYLITFFYTALGLFFLCLNGRENHDIEYSLTLPVRKREIVAARIAFAVAIEVLQLLLAAGFALLHNRLMPAANAVGMDANVAFFGFALLLLGLYNLLFFAQYYANPAKVGKAFVVASTVVMVYILAVETLTHVVPFFRDVLDTPDPQHMLPKLVVLGVGTVAYAVFTLLALRVSAARFEALDL